MEKEKYAAAKKALSFVKKGMKIGLGTGSTAKIFIDLLGGKNRKEKLKLTCIATSVASEKQAALLGLPIAGFDAIKRIDIAFDGADQVDEKHNLVKGLGGALVREKIVDYRAKKFVVLVGEKKLVKNLSGTVPIEVIPLAEYAVKRDLISLGAKKVEKRMQRKKPFISDNGNIVLHAEFGEIKKPEELERKINEIAGVVDSGIFSKKKPIVIVGREDGTARIMR